MNYNFYLVDDDMSVLSILSKIIVNQNLGDVIGRSTSGERAINEIKTMKPDIVIVDLLLPKIDGIALVSALKPLMPETPFIMISEVHSKDMVSKAYSSGVEFFVNKPINVIEVINVIERVDENLKMKKVISSFQNAFMNMKALDHLPGLKKTNMPQSAVDEAKSIFSQIGILSEAGSKDLLHILVFMFENEIQNIDSLIEFKLSELYTYVRNKYEKEKGEIVHEKTIEQRIRRAIGQAMSNVAEFGLDDYDHMVFVNYGSTLFDFKEVRKEMDFIKKSTNVRGKVNVKKFVIGMVNAVQTVKEK